MSEQSNGTPLYREHAPHPELRRYVECYWTITSFLPPRERLVHRVLPDGCMDILFSMGDAPAAPFAVGTMTRPLDVERAGRVDLLGVRFRPGGARPWLGVPARELTDLRADLYGLWGSAARGLHERLGATPARAQRLRVLDDALRARLARPAAAPDELVLRATELTTASRGRAPVTRLAAATGLGRRQLERRFLTEVGVAPKLACRVARFRAAVSLLHDRPRTDLSAVAFDAGYADQPHLTREFRALAGMTPGAYRRRHAAQSPGPGA